VRKQRTAPVKYAGLPCGSTSNATPEQGLLDFTLTNSPLEEALKAPVTVVSSGGFPVPQQVGNERLDVLPLDAGHIQGHPLVDQVLIKLPGSPDVGDEGLMAQILGPDVPPEGIDIDAQVAA